MFTRAASLRLTFSHACRASAINCIVVMSGTRSKSVPGRRLRFLSRDLIRE